MKWPFSKETALPPPAAKQAGTTSPALKLDLGCGKSKKIGFLGIDRREFEGVDAVTDLSQKAWIFQNPQIGPVRLVPFGHDGTKFVLPDSCVAEFHCSHFLEHLEHNQHRPERVRFLNELWRVLMPGGVGKIITPHWASNRTYGDFTHADKPVAESFYMYLNKEWRISYAPDNDIEFHPDGYNCDFDYEYGYGLHPDFQEKSDQERDFASKWYRDAPVELHARITARKE